MLKVYPASKLYHADKFKMWNLSQKEVYFCARWLQHSYHLTPDTEEHAEGFWTENQVDVATADALLVYAEPADLLFGGLVEVGMALAYGLPVFLVGQHRCFSTWQYHQLVCHRTSMDDFLSSASERIRPCDHRIFRSL